MPCLERTTVNPDRQRCRTFTASSFYAVPVDCDSTHGCGESDRLQEALTILPDLGHLVWQNPVFRRMGLSASRSWCRHAAETQVHGDPAMRSASSAAAIWTAAVSPDNHLHATRAGSITFAHRALSRLPALADHDGVHESAADSRRGQLAERKLRIARGRAHGCRPATRIRSSIYRISEFPASARHDGAEHRRLYGHRSGVPGRSSIRQRFRPAVASASLRFRRVAHECATNRRGPAGAAAGLCRSANQSSGCVCPAIQSDRGVCAAERRHSGRAFPHHVRSRHWYRRFDRQQPTLGLGRLGMELGITPSLLQPRLLGWMGTALSSAGNVVSTTTGRVGESSRVRGQLAVPSAELYSPAARPASSRAPTVERDESSGIRIQTAGKPTAKSASAKAARKWTACK